MVNGNGLHINLCCTYLYKISKLPKQIKWIRNDTYILNIVYITHM